jgi:hypothetical protein
MKCRRSIAGLCLPTVPGLAALWLISLVSLTSAQETNLADPRTFGFDIPAGKISPAGGERVATTDAEGAAVVAKTQVRVGASRIVMLPDGQLVARKSGQAEPTERPYVPLTKEQLAERLLEGEFKGFKVKQTKHYIYLYTTSDQFAFGTTKILESMYPGVKKWCESQRLPAHDPEVPLVVVMFRTEDDFQRYRRMPDGVVAYYDGLSNRVAVFEESDRFGSRRDLAIQQAISTIAHEGTHQILHNLGVQQRLSIWPMWLSEGLAEFLAPTEVNKKLQWKGAAQVNDLRMFELEQYVKSRSGEEPNGDTVRHTVLAARLTSTGYASAWSLTHYLATKRKAEFTKYLGEVAKTGPLEGSVLISAPGVVKGNVAPFEKQFGGDYVDLEKKLIAHLQKLPYDDPFANMPHFVAMITYSDGKRPQREVGTFHSPVSARKWAEETREKLSGADRPVIREFPNRPAAETFARAWKKGM